MTKDEALKLALEALESKFLFIAGDGEAVDQRAKVITAIKEALAQPEQEPVAWMYEVNGAHTILDLFEPPDDAYDEGTLHPLYTTPPQRTWVGLTPQERDEINEQVYGAVPHYVAFHHAIEAKLKGKNT